MQISLGQEFQKRCNACGMEYTASSAEDRKLHDKYHKQNTEGYDVGKDFVKRARDGTVFPGAISGDSVCAVDCFDKPATKRRAQAVLEIVQRELGAVPIDENAIWDAKDNDASKDGDPGYRAYMYIKGTKCVGFLLVEKITEARRVVEPAVATIKRSASAPEGGRTALSALWARKQALEEATAQAARQPIQLSTTPYPACIGISRIWTAPTHRKQDIATMLLDTAVLDHEQRVERCQAMEKEPGTGLSVKGDGLPAPVKVTLDNKMVLLKTLRGKEAVAFSQPTEAGARLARRWFGKLYGWSVYVD